MAILTNVAKSIFAGRMLGATPAQAEPKFGALGTGTTAEAATQTALVTEFTTGTWTGYARSSGTTSQVTTTQTNDTWQCINTFTAPAAEAPTEFGLFDASTVGNMLMRAVFSVVNLASGDSLQLTTKVQFS